MNELRFDGRTAIVTGAGGNPSLGRAHAMLLASRGANVVVNDIGSDPESPGYKGTASAEAVVDEIQGAGGTAVADGNSVATESGAGALIQTALDAFGSVDILVNNAAISIQADFDELSSRDFQRHIDINIMGCVWTCRAAWPYMKRASYGRIVNVTSGALAGLGRLSAYGVTKGGVFALSRMLAVDGAGFGIKANSLNPAAHTRMLESQQDEGSSLLIYARQNQPAELVSPAVALLSHESCPVTGECITAGGGGFSRFYVAQTKGIVDADITVERLAERFDEVMDETGANALNAGFIDVTQWAAKPYRKPA
jgi:NAD(P)-dependent dehydrogenase (short-subunit alcohol dehydrogenase family)